MLAVTAHIKKKFKMHFSQFLIRVEANSEGSLLHCLMEWNAGANHFRHNTVVSQCPFYQVLDALVLEAQCKVKCLSNFYNACESM